jgi:eukaryotic-like serine/threonine-protein kinase
MSEAVDRLNEALEGRYVVLRELGQGGMATVYLADDQKHQRKVAVKVLKSALAAVVGAERFLAEIRTTANLQHPHILPLFDSGEAGGFLFYVMPYVEGETLEDRISREGQLQMKDALRIASAVAGALSYAHRQGVIHRDIKPANILLQDGQPVVADFGIALAVSAAGGGRLTETGLSLGTPYYMSPEQATADRSPGPGSDVYSLACVLHEMLTGEPPYTGPSAQAVLAKIITGAPVRPSENRPTIPPHVESVILRGLEKLPADRFESAEAFALALEDEAFRHGQAAEETVGASAAEWRKFGLTMAGFAVILGGLLVGGLARSPADLPVHRFSINLDHPRSHGFAVSPDGSQFAYRDTLGAVWLKDLRTSEETQVSSTESFGRPVFSPDGTELILYNDETAILERLRLDGTSRKEMFFEGVWSGGGGLGAAWISKDEVVVTAFAQVGRISLAGEGDFQAVRESDLRIAEVFRTASALPDGDHVLVGRSEKGGVWTVGRMALSDGSFEVIVAGSEPTYAGGYLFFVSEDGVLQAAPYDPSTTRLSGDAIPLATNLHRGRLVSPAYSVSEAGVLIYQTQGSIRPGFVTQIDRQGTPDRVAMQLADSGPITQLAMSPDGRQIAYTAGEQVWLQDVEGGLPPRRLGRTSMKSFVPSWGPDGDFVYFLTSAREDSRVRTLNRQRADLSRPPEVVLQTERGIWDFAVHPDGHTVLLVYEEGLQDGEFAVADLNSEAPPAPFTQAGSLDEHSPSFSPDGRWLAYQTNDLGRYEVFVIDFPEGERRTQVSVDGGHSPRWSRNESEIVYPDMEQQLWSLAVSSDSAFTALGRAPLFSVSAYRGTVTWDYRTAYTATPDEREFLFPNPGGAAAGEMFVVLNVFEELRNRAGR